VPILGTIASFGLSPEAPTIGTATDGGTGTTATVTYTAPTWAGKTSGSVTYTATSSPGGFTGTGSSPITISGLTTGTSYTFTVTATTSYGVTGPASAASNSVTPASPGSFDSIASFTPTGSSVTFSSIPQTYKHLQIRATLRDNGSSTSPLYVRVNGSSSGYYRNTQGTQGVNSSNSNSVGSAQWQFNNVVMGSSFTGGTVKGAMIMNLYDYSQTTYRKGGTALTTMVYSGESQSMIRNNALHFDTLNAITSVTLFIDNSFVASTISLYGIGGV
jgi:hypothetical protein